MLKLTFEGANASELHGNIGSYLSAVQGGASVAGAASGSGTKATAAPTLADVQKALTGIKGKKDQKIALLTKFMASDLDGLEESEYPAFLEGLEAIKNS